MDTDTPCNTVGSTVCTLNAYNTVSDRTENVGKEERGCRMADSDESDVR